MRVSITITEGARGDGTPGASSVVTRRRPPRRDGGEGAKRGAPLPGAVKEFERKRLLERIQREGATIGANIPDRIDVQGEEVELRDFVFQIKSRDTVPESERDRVEQAKRNLRRERRERLERIEEGDVPYEEGERLAESIVGIDRALNALEQLRPVDLNREAELQETQDRKRWVRFLKQALGHDDDNKGIRR